MIILKNEMDEIKKWDLLGTGVWAKGEHCDCTIYPVLYTMAGKYSLLLDVIYFNLRKVPIVLPN